MTLLDRILIAMAILMVVGTAGLAITCPDVAQDPEVHKAMWAFSTLLLGSMLLYAISSGGEDPE